ncbi:MAG: hypothetical protein A2285_09650 [Elusimicrobia bacterium RIFOXYA12_FULL_57_11]|nr:MAG: hypothetical protein A2285_09650 [Elusimicrobia bacterium RIFOXYA12_FULL_57_11]
MKTKNEKLIWRKAAVLGSIWAASEIVLGSFLHNARVPFKGELLTAIGIAILIAGRRLWPERGLLWRTGLVCAAMKSVSPSAAIFGPMTAIFVEGLLAEAGVLLLGGNIAGYLFAGGLVMSWPLAHKLVNLLIFYGPDTVNVYLRGIDWLRLRFGLETGHVWAPLLVMFAAYFLAGMAAAAAGLRAGREKADLMRPSGKQSRFTPRPSGEARRAYSLGALVLHIVFVVAVMAAGRKMPAAALAAVAVIYGYLCAHFYARARALLGHAGVWAGVLAASIIAGYMLGSAQAGLYMALRAFLLTLAFAAIGCELLNPSIRRLLERFGGGVLFETLEYAFSSLPGIIAGLPSGRDFARRPLAVIGEAVARAPFFLDTAVRPAVFIITGAHGGGKSELVMELARLLRAAGKRPAGICAAGLWENGVRAGFDFVDLASGKRVPLCRRGVPGASVRAGEFGFYSGGLAAGTAALSAENASGADVVFVDEIGFLELEGGGWAPALERLLSSSRPVVIVVRDYLLVRVLAQWGLHSAAILHAGKTSSAAAMEWLRCHLNPP